MKKMLILALSLLTLSTATMAQKKGLGTPKKEQPAAVAPATPQLEKPTSDTMKVRVHYYASTEEGLKYVSYEDGYAVRTTTFVPKPSITNQQEAQSLVVNPKTGYVGINQIRDDVYDKKFKPFAFTIQTVVPYDWKE